MFIRQDGPELEVLAPAKINLFLEVTGKRDDGFHDLDMLMVPVALYDTVKLILQQSPEISLNSRWAFGLESQPALPPAHENLVMQALELFQQHLEEKHGKSFGLSVDLVKRIPAAAGLGGASSDAAAGFSKPLRRISNENQGTEHENKEKGKVQIISCLLICTLYFLWFP